MLHSQLEIMARLEMLSYLKAEYVANVVPTRRSRLDSSTISKERSLTGAGIDSPKNITSGFSYAETREYQVAVLAKFV